MLESNDCKEFSKREFKSTSPHLAHRSQTQNANRVCYSMGYDPETDEEKPRIYFPKSSPSNSFLSKKTSHIWHLGLQRRAATVASHLLALCNVKYAPPPPTAQEFLPPVLTSRKPKHRTVQEHLHGLSPIPFCCLFCFCFGTVDSWSNLTAPY